jgi:hypothetical protein
MPGRDGAHAAVSLSLSMENLFFPEAAFEAGAIEAVSGRATLRTAA